ncbi:hypothetical protein JCM10449v2_005256 [Rhodotorula kratochvilovae]
MDDELDPAFLDLDDLPPRASGASSSSLGAGFGAALSSPDHGDDDNDDDDPLAAHAHAPDLDLDLELGGGFGHPAGAGELDALDSAHDPSDEDEALRTPPRRRGGSTLSVGGGGGGLSLAAELASAARPQRQRDLMRELGLGDDEDEEGASAEDAYSAEEEDEEDALGAAFGRATPASADGDDPFGGSPRRSASSLARLVRTRPSSASLASYTPNSTPQDDAEADEMAQEEIDAALQEAAASLERSMETTTAFLAHLRQHVTAELDPHATSSTPAPALDGSLERTLSSSSSSDPLPPIDYTDRQPIVEAQTSTLVRRLYDLAKQRESQLRELTEGERILGRTKPGWRAVLAELEPLDFSDDDDEAVDDDDVPIAPNGVNAHLPPDASRSASPFSTASDAAPRAPSPRSRSTAQSTAALADAHSDLAALRTLTTSLLSALSSISDLTQVQSALASDAGRKLRALKAQASAVRDELGAVERCEAFVQAYEAREPRRASGEGEGRRAAQARREVEGVRERLEEGWARAQSILAVRA